MESKDGKELLQNRNDVLPPSYFSSLHDRFLEIILILNIKTGYKLHTDILIHNIYNFFCVLTSKKEISFWQKTEFFSEKFSIQTLGRCIF